MARRYHVLDGVRGVAAGAVLLLHAYVNAAPARLASAVDIFYLLSGFVIADAYEQRIRTEGPWPFMLARLQRLYPMFLIGLAILPAYLLWYRMLGGAWVVSPSELVESLGLNSLYIPTHLTIPGACGQGMLFALDGPAWSLMFEMMANIIFAFLLPWLTNRVLVVIVAASAVGLVMLHFRGGYNVGFSWQTARWAIPRVGYSFSLGVLMWRARLPLIAASPWFVLALTALALIAPPTATILIGGPLILLLGRRFDDFPGARVLGLLGALSYPLYAIHVPLLNILAWNFEAHRISGWWVAPFWMIVCAGFAYAALKLWDEPARRWLAARRRARTEELVSP